MNVISRIIAGKEAAYAAGLRPCEVELGVDELKEVSHTICVLPGSSLLGMQVSTRPSGIAILALPDRKIGRFECVVPERFEVAA